MTHENACHRNYCLLQMNLSCLKQGNIIVNIRIIDRAKNSIIHIYSSLQESEQPKSPVNNPHNKYVIQANVR